MNDYYVHTSEYQQPSLVPTIPPEKPPLPPHGHHHGHNHHHHNGGGNRHQYAYNPSAFNVDFKELLKRALKYLLEGLSVAFVAYYFTRGKLDTKEIIMLGITAAFVFAILDTFAPTISFGARFGAGFGVGQAMFGLNPTVFAPTVLAV